MSESMSRRNKFTGINSDYDEEYRSNPKEEMDPLMEENMDLGFFKVWLIISQAVGVVLVVLVTIWCGQHLGGFSWQSNPSLEFNYHPLFMVVGLIVFYGDALLVYRAFRNKQKKFLKLLHLGLHSLAFIFSVVGLKAVFDSHNLHDPALPNLYSAHSWIGLLAVILFATQYLLGFLVFLYPGTTKKYRTQYLPAHVFSGLAIFVMACAAALMGIAEKVIFSISNFNQMPPGAVTANILSYSVVLFCGLVVYIVSTSQFKRQMLPEEVQLQLEKHSPSH